MAASRRVSVKHCRPPGALRRRDAAADPDDGMMTLAAIGEAMGLTRERVRQIEASALRKVALALQARGLTVRDLSDDE